MRVDSPGGIGVAKAKCVPSGKKQQKNGGDSIEQRSLHFVSKGNGGVYHSGLALVAMPPLKVVPFWRLAATPP
jgi:hypothetical protein